MCCVWFMFIYTISFILAYSWNFLVHNILGRDGEPTLNYSDSLFEKRYIYGRKVLFEYAPCVFCTTFPLLSLMSPYISGRRPNTSAIHLKSNARNHYERSFRHKIYLEETDYVLIVNLTDFVKYIYFLILKNYKQAWGNSVPKTGMWK